MIPQLLESAYQLEASLCSLGAQYCVIGGVALQRWGAPRATLDVDITLLAEFGTERAAAESLLALFASRIEDAVAFAMMHRVVLLRDRWGTPINVALGAMPFEVRSVARSSSFAVGDNKSICTCSAEDLVVHKCFAGRPQDWVDLKSILTRTPNLDWALIDEELIPLLELKEEPEAWLRLQALRSGA